MEMDFAMYHTMNPIRFMIRPDLNVAQDVDLKEMLQSSLQYIIGQGIKSFFLLRVRKEMKMSHRSLSIRLRFFQSILDSMILFDHGCHSEKIIFGNGVGLHRTSNK